MKPRDFIGGLDDARIVAAIAAAERTTSGEIRVCISHRRRADALAAARERFHKLGMERTRHRNGALIFFVPRTRQFAVWGDCGVHDRCGDDFWKGTVSEMTAHLRKGNFTEAILFAVQRLGGILARHFPPEPGDRNELPNTVVRDE